MSAHQGLALSRPALTRSFLVTGVAGVVLLAGCAAQRPAPPPAAEVIRCIPAAAGDALVGSWLSVHRQKGVAGELHTHIVLNADGTMRYGEQLRRPRNPPQGLEESGCWQRDGNSVQMRTLESNGSPVDTDDPIYLNRYSITREGGDRMRLKSPEGVDLDFKRMPPDYRLPW
ncbi:MAG TPA: hypothetical protein VKZ52_03485 [Burkholderiaceae bacterium]|nr:hypothetical protein [Burkholderiaceae bacterium]